VSIALRPSRRNLVLAIVAGIAGVAISVTALVGFSSLSSPMNDLVRRDLPASEALQNVATSLTLGQNSFITAIEATDPTARDAALTVSIRTQQTTDAEWASYLHVAKKSAGEQALQKKYTDVTQLSRSLGGALFTAKNQGSDTFARQLAAERTASDQGVATILKIKTTYYDTPRSADARAIVNGINDGRAGVLLISLIALIMFLSTAFLTYRGARRDEGQIEQAQRKHALEERRTDLETRLQRGLEMEPNEESTYHVIARALDVVTPGQSVELLVADSSRAHFRQVLSTGVQGAYECGVASPNDCPAATSGQTRVFPDSRNLDACPYLRDHAEPAWASCVPVSITGRTTGVLHAEGPLTEPPAEDLAEELELVARKTGDRIGVLRVLARTEAQAQADPLTGLPNRRTLENRTRELLKDDVPFVVAYADLDHFKVLNDTHGHETGDRALRLFARVLRDTVRPNDIPARFGGEEFVVVLPDCSLVDARTVADRIREQLAVAITKGVVPEFTVSIGIAASTPGEKLSDVTRHADAALLRAKALGRDRVVSAGELLASVPPDTAAGSA
jgi:diguanylate cyclase (GGDEF)-like protein